MATPPPTFEPLADDASAAHYVLTLLALKGNTAYPSGSAVLIGPNIALTARHVTDDFFTNLQAPNAPTTNYRADYTIFARGFFSGAWRMFSVKRIFNTAGTDIVALYLEPTGDTNGFSWPTIRMDMLPARRGEKVFSYGHTNPKAFMIEPDISRLAWAAHFHVSTGYVEDIFPEKRDNYMLNFPAFQFDARVDGSMSGGPVFDESGALVGINSSSLAATTETPRHTSYAALLWPVLALPFDNPAKFGSYKFIDDLRLSKLIDVVNHEYITVDRTVDSGELRVSVAIPEDRL